MLTPSARSSSLLGAFVAILSSLNSSLYTSPVCYWVVGRCYLPLLVTPTASNSVYLITVLQETLSLQPSTLLFGLDILFLVLIFSLCWHNWGLRTELGYFYGCYGRTEILKCMYYCATTDVYPHSKTSLFLLSTDTERCLQPQNNILQL